MLENQKRIQTLAYVLIAFSAVCLLVFYAWPIAKIGTFHLRVVEAFNSDEGEFLWPVSQAFGRGDFNIGRYDYGLLYYNLGLVAFFLLDLVVDIDSQKMIELFRIESFLFLLATAVLFYDYGRRYVNQFVGIMSFVAVTLLSETFIHYGLMLHPDTCQLFFIALSVYGLSRYSEAQLLKWALVSLAGAGLAFSTKYAGIALLPMILLMFMLRPAIQLKETNIKVQRMLLLALLAISAALFNVNWISGFITQDVDATASLYLLIDLARWFSVLAIVYVVIQGLWKSEAGKEWRNRLEYFLLILYGSGAAFFFFFLLGSPQSIYRFNFINGLLYVTNLHKDGHWFRDESGLMGWMQLLLHPETLGWLVMAFAGIGVVWVLSQVRKTVFTSPKTLPLIWVISFLLIVVFRVKSKFAHYLIPIIPFFIFYAVLGVNGIIEMIFKKKEQYKLIGSVCIVLLLVGVQVMRLETYKEDRFITFAESDAMEAGYWINDNIHEEVFILADKYTYIPARMNIKHRTVWGIHPSNIDEFQPDYLVIQYEVYRKFLDPNGVEDYLYGKDVYLARNALYTSLLADEHAEYKLLQDFDEVKVYQLK